MDSISQFKKSVGEKVGSSDLPKGANDTGLPDLLKSGIENLSGYFMDDVKVYYNSGKPAQLQAHAFAQGTDIHLGSGQENHLPHEARHVVQQKQGRVKPTLQVKGGANVNDDELLEREADVMGAKALYRFGNNLPKTNAEIHSNAPIQAKLYYASNSDREFSSEEEVKNFFAGAQQSHVSESDLLEGLHSDRLQYVNFRGFLAGRHGYQVLSIEEYTARPAVAGRGSAGLQATDNSVGFVISGRPAWTEETLEKLKPIKFRDNIRHIIPYHMISDGFMFWLNNVFTSANGDLSQVKVEVGTLALKLGVTVENPLDISKEAIQGLCVSILGMLNNIPGNLWAGDKVENQRLNSLRQRIEGIKAAIESGIDAPGIIAHRMLGESIAGSGDRIYKEILLGALQYFPERHDQLAAMSKEKVSEILDLIHISGEIDAMPSTPELGRFSDEGVQQFLSNLPIDFKVLELFQSGNVENAIILLSELTDPYTEYKKQ